MLCYPLPKPQVGPCEPTWAPQPSQSLHYSSSSQPPHPPSLPSSGPSVLPILLNTSIILSWQLCSVASPTPARYCHHCDQIAPRPWPGLHGHGAGTCTEHTMKPLRHSLASHWGPPAQPGGVPYHPQLKCHPCHTDGVTIVTPLPSPCPCCHLIPSHPTLQCPCPPAHRRGNVVPLLSCPRSQPSAQPGRICPVSPRV